MNNTAANVSGIRVMTPARAAARENVLRANRAVSAALAALDVAIASGNGNAIACRRLDLTFARIDADDARAYFNRTR